MKRYSLDKDTVIQCILEFFPRDYKISSLAENARSLYFWAKKRQIEQTGFYMLGSMGQELSMGLGISLGIKKSPLRCIVISSDGSLLSNTNALCTIGVMKPDNLVIIVLDNEMHRTTGKQITASKYLSLKRIAESCGFIAYEVKTKQELVHCLQTIRTIAGPIFIQIKINDRVASTENTPSPIRIYQQFIDYVRSTL